MHKVPHSILALFILAACSHPGERADYVLTWKGDGIGVAVAVQSAADTVLFLNDYLVQMFHEKPPQYKYCRAFLLVHCFWCSFFIFLHYFQCKVLYLQKSKSVWNSYTIPSASNCP